MPTLSHQALLLRVLAWHNRHPLARRIKASQVHSIGEVMLPFASAQAQPDAAEPSAWDLVSEFGASLAAAGPLAVAGGLIEVGARAAAESAAAPALPSAATDSAAPDLAAAQHEGETAIDMPTLDLAPSEPPPAETLDALAAKADLPTAPLLPAAAEPAATTAAPAEATAPALPTPALDAEPPALPAGAQPAAGAAGTAAAAAAAAAPTVPARLKRHGAMLLRRLAALMPRRRSRAAPLQPLFSRSIVWPLPAAAIARWGQRHGQPQALLPADALRRRVEIDAKQQGAATAQGLPQLQHLHVLSATIVDGDRRMRVLMSPAGAVLGSRAYSRPRQASAAALLMLGMLGAGLGLGLGLGGGRPSSSDDAGAPGLLAAASAGPHAAASDAVNEAANHAAVAASAAASSTANADAHAEPRAAAEHAGAGHAAASAPASTAVDPAQAAGLHAAAAAAAAPAASGTSLARVRPQLSDQDKRQAREQSARFHADQPAASGQTQAAAELAKGPVYALVSRPSQVRDDALRNLKLMKLTRTRMASPTPEQAELVQQHGQWRAAWWPFGNQAEAERARVLLSGRGLRTEVVEF